MDYCIRKTEMTDNKEDDVTFASYEWENIKATTASQLPTCRNCHTATTFKHYMIIFGGKEGEGRKKFCNDIHILDLKRLNWTSQIKITGQIPDVRMGHSAQNYYDKIIYYGGWNGYTVLDDVILISILYYTQFYLFIYQSAVVLGQINMLLQLKAFFESIKNINNFSQRFQTLNRKILLQIINKKIFKLK